MITKQTTDYSKLFEKASIALGAQNEGEYITSLNEYFRNIVDLAAIDLQYTILPLDEETFDIDANTREITIPPSFKNGVGVQGDQVAEIIYFSIDRYFDATDLNTQNIYIEWRKKDGDEGVSKEYVRDLTTLPNKIIFGWPLQSEITALDGAVEFAVRFYTIKEENGNKEIVYSFATKPARIMINKSMNFDITQAGPNGGVDEYDAKEMIINRFQNSVLTDGEIAIDAPIFFDEYKLVAGDYDLFNNDGYDLFPESYALKTQAYGSGRITYFLEASEPDKNDWTSVPYVEPTYILTKDETKKENKIYYKQLLDQESGKILGYTVLEENEEIPSVNNQTVFEKFGLYYITDAGKYRMRAQNRVGANYANILSDVVTFPAPVAPVVDTTTESVILTKQPDGSSSATLSVPVIGELPTGAITYQWSSTKNGVLTSVSETANTLSVQDVEDMYQVVVTNKRNNRSISSKQATFRVTYPAEKPSIIADLGQYAIVGDKLSLTIDTSKNYDDVVVRWYEVKDVKKGIDVTQDEAGNWVFNDDLRYTDQVNGSGLAEYTPDQTGVFYAVLTAVYNTDVSEPVYSLLCSVS